ncbi:hypothetical protein ID866_4872 [Astraeus odoratus]|nr:hypothetical protein ID866_4872 [Astraeus odoratus]
MLKEGLDVNSLGAVDTPVSSNLNQPGHESASPTPLQKEMRTPRLVQAPATPTVVPPTPSPSAVTPNITRAPSSSSSNEVFYDAEDTDMHTKRRSIYRSPGTSSSPDLATLVRKAKERGGIVPANLVQSQKEKRPEPPPPLPSAPSSSTTSAAVAATSSTIRASTRARSSTSSAANSPAPPKLSITPAPYRSGTRSAKDPISPSGSDWVMASPRSRTSSKADSDKVSKNSVRAKTSAFLGRMLGQSTTRERSRTDTSLPGSSHARPTFADAFVPPVPPLPGDVQRMPSPMDVFTGPRVNSQDHKPLPPIRGAPIDRVSNESDGSSLVVVDPITRMKGRTPSPEKHSIDRPGADRFISHGKRRSMSVSDIDIQKITLQSSPAPTLPPKDYEPHISGHAWESTSSLTGILSDFKGVLSKLDPDPSSSLDLRDPCTPARRTTLTRPTASTDTTTAFQTDARSPLLPSIHSSVPSVSLSTESSAEVTCKQRLDVEPVVPPRSSSLQTPARSHSGSSAGTASVVSPRIPPLRHGSSPLKAKGYGNQMQSSYRDMSRLRTHHRSGASNSEPSLLSTSEDGRATLALSPHHELSTNDLVINRYASNPALSNIEDTEQRGKELAARCYREDEEFLSKDKIAEWLGGNGRLNKIALRYYMDYYDFTGLRLDNAFRRLCAKLYLKAETQQVDRILEEFSRRFWDCNGSRLYASANVVHAVTYSLLLLNTDLHVADIANRMSRSQFVRNTMTGVTSMAAFLTPALGFASNLSHTIIRETQEDEDRSFTSNVSDSTNISISDEELALLGPPWAKEGMLCRKQYWESAGKRAKSKGWMDVFVVIQRGELNMFVFGVNGSTSSGIVGGGNWLENAQSVGTVHLAHSLAHALPPPGYSKQRPHCMVLTLANGGVYFFQTGTEELVNEWVSTCNYWAARTSKEPLAGGVSNMEYGWSRVADDAHVRSASDNETARDLDRTDTLSVRSGRSNRSKFGWRDGAQTVRIPHSPWAERVYINDWKPPIPPSISSINDEESQLEALQKYVGTLKRDLKRHNELREPMVALYAPRSTSGVKAQSNWEKKSQYLLTEIVKYESYIDSLKDAMSLRLKKRGEKALERALVNASPHDPIGVVSSGEKCYPREVATPDADELSNPIPGHFHHCRETAESG